MLQHLTEFQGNNGNQSSDWYDYEELKRATNKGYFSQCSI